MTLYGENKIALKEQRGTCVEILRVFGLVLLGLMLFPFFLVFFCPIMTPIILQSKFRSVFVKIIMVLVGIFIGCLMVPLFMIACLVYLLYFVGYRSLRVCGCEDCDCCSLTGLPYTSSQ